MIGQNLKTFEGAIFNERVFFIILRSSYRGGERPGSRLTTDRRPTGSCASLRCCTHQRHQPRGVATSDQAVWAQGLNTLRVRLCSNRAS
jgi:hypothetical protein